ncbi:MAG: PLxRFG domain-containing protein, partial [Thermotogota bacterium]|nr:PLxRFG domain-containing protein [Thermotogota bacterium]
TAENMEEAKATLLHEVQHVIQLEEGFAKGGSPTPTYFFEDMVKKTTLKRLKNEGIKEANRRINNAETQAEYEAMRKEREVLVQTIKELEKDPEVLNPYEVYHRLAGEIEARDTSARVKLTPKQRREQFPYESQGIPEDQWIITDGKGTSFSVEERKQFATKGVDYKKMLREYQEAHTTPLVDELIERTQADFDPVNSTPEKTKAFKKSVGFLPKRFRSEVLSVRDMKWYHKALETPYVLAKKFPCMEKAVRTEIRRHENRTKKVFGYYHGELADFQKHVQKNKEDLNAFTELTWECENERFPEKDVPTDWYSVVEDKEADNYGDLQINPQHYVEVKKYLAKQGVKDIVADGFITVRKLLDNVLIEADTVMRRNNIDPTDLEEFRSFIGKSHNYFPHIREGNSYIKIINRNTKKTVYREHFWALKERALPERKMAKARTEKWLNDQLASGELSGERSDYLVSPAQKVTQLPDEVFFQIPVEALSQIAGEAGKGLSAARVHYEAKRLMKKEGLSEKEAHDKAYNILTDDIERHLAKAMADVLKTRGWGKHSIQRQNIPGFKKTDVFETLSGYLTGYAGFATKIQAAKEHSKTLRDMDARKTPNAYKYTSGYIRDMLANADKTDRMVDRLRGLFFVKYLGGVVKSGVVNLTQNAVMAGPILSQHTKFSHTKLARAMKDVRESITGKNAWMGKETEYTTLPKNEQKALTEMVETGAAQDLYLRELKGDIPGKGWGKYVRKVMDKTGVFMMVAEKFNRASTGLAAYRVAMNEGALYDGKQTKGNHDLSVRFAKKVIYDSHFLYGKSNLPASFRGGDFRKVARAAYTFRSFTHNYLDIMVDLMANQGTQGFKVAGRSMMNIMMVGGLTSIPFFKALSEVIKWAQDDDDEDMLTEIRSKMPNKFMQDMVVYGLSGAVGGFDLSGSLSIEVPRNFKEIVGVPYSMYEDSINMVRSVKAGNVYRAVSETPFTPIVMRNAMRGIELYTKGQRTRGGKAINVPGKREPRKITGVEAIKKTVLGLQ